MEELLKTYAGAVASAIEVAAVVIIVVGATEAFVQVVGTVLSRKAISGARKKIWVRFGVWLLLGLEFELAADVVRTAISPTWTDIAQLGAIAVIRTFLNYFLEKDLEKYEENEAKKTEPPTVEERRLTPAA